MKTARGLSVVEGSLAEDKAGLSLPTTGRPGCELVYHARGVSELARWSSRKRLGASLEKRGGVDRK
jgi:hypothetical protein